MKKHLFLALAVVLALAQSARAIPMHNINLNLGISLPGETEILTYYNISSVSESIRAYNFGLSYDFAPVEFMSVGAGLNFVLRSFIMPYLTYEDNVTFMAIEPFGQIRGYIPVMEGFDIFAGIGAGFASLINSSLVNGQYSTTTAIQGGGVTYKFGGGIAYNQGIFTAIMDIGYKVATIVTSPAVTNPLPPGNSLTVNLGGLYFTVSAALSFGKHVDVKSDSDIKKQLDRDVSGLDTSGAEEASEEKAPVTYAQAVEKTEDAGPPPSDTKEALADNSATEEPVADEKPVAEEKPVVDEKPVETAQVEENPDDTDGIIILSPGESETSELEKYITNKRKQFKQVEDEPEGQEEAGTDLIFNYEPEDSGVIVVESESKGTVDRAGYVLVEKGGFISRNFSEDGFIYSLDEHKELLSAGDFAYIKLTVGKGAPKGKQFTIFDDSEEILNQATGESMGKLIKFLGVVKVAGNIEDNIFKVQITKSYEPIRNNYKIKARQDLKKYHKDINLKVRKKNLEVRAFIIKVKDDVRNLKSRDLVYLDAGISKGLLPGEKMGIFRQTTDAETGKESEYDRLGTLIIINSMQSTSVGLIIKNSGVIKVGDIVKTLGK